MDYATLLLTEQAIRVWQAGNDISLTLASALIDMGVDVEGLERRYVR